MIPLTVLLSALPSGQYMHIPDGYLSPATAIVLFLLVLPFWVRGVRVLRQRMSSRNVPLIALFAAFSFVIMMFNVPLPGGTTGHAVGGALAAIILGPEIATIAISIALIMQAFFFGDGGILALGANCFNMAVVLPYVSYAIYQAVASKSEVTSTRRVWGAALAGYLGLTVAAFLTGVEFGIQPALFHTAQGAPLYAPYPLAVAIPAMVLPHMAVASWVEAMLTGAVVAYLQRANRPALLLVTQPQLSGEAGTFGRLRALWIGLAVLVVATPLGLLAPGTAWGEWSGEELAGMGLGFVPKGMAQLASLWGAPLPDYDLPALGNVTLAYVLSALLGVVLVALVVWLLTAVLTARRTTEPSKAGS
jgi:cobalt/nickel transport system permease protein